MRLLKRRPSSSLQPRMEPRRRRDGPPRVAAITMVRDESVMLPRWLAHYGRECGLENLVVLDDGSSDGSTDSLPCSVLRLPPLDAGDYERTRMTLVSGVAAGLLSRYDAVIFADADEFLVADPERYAGLTDLVQQTPDVDILGAVGLNVVHDVRREPPLDPATAVLSQRSWAKFIPLMSKPAIRRVPVAWAAASHGARAPFGLHPDLYLFHLKFADRDLLDATAHHRRALVLADGRAATTSWKLGGDRMVALLEEITDVDPADVHEFRPRAKDLDSVVREDPRGVWRAHGAKQVPAMRRQPMVRIPERFSGAV